MVTPLAARAVFDAVVLCSETLPVAPLLIIMAVDRGLPLRTPSSPAAP